MHSRVDIDSGSNDLVTLAAVKLELGITTTSEDDQLAARITRESRLIAEACDRVFAFGDAVETFTFDRDEITRRGQALALTLYPVDEIESVVVNGQAIEESNFEIDLSRGRLWLVDASWSGTVIVTYSGGYVLPDGAPATLQLACIESVRERRIAGSSDDLVQSVQHGDLHVRYFQRAGGGSGLPAGVDALIDEYKRPAIA